MLRLLLRFVVALGVGALVFTVAHAQTEAAPAIVVQAAQEAGLSAKGGDLTWPAAAAVTAWRAVDLVAKAIDHVRAMFDRWIDLTGGRVLLSLRYTAVTTHAEVDPEPTRPIRVETSDYEGPDRRGRKRLAPVADDEETPQ